jgi:predicted nucleic acid-binding protein
MNGLDTNVLIRYLVADDEAQATKAKRYIESGVSYVNCSVLSEVVWVLESAYGYDKEAIISALERLLSTHEVEVEDADVALAALHESSHPILSTNGQSLLSCTIEDDLVTQPILSTAACCVSRTIISHPNAPYPCGKRTHHCGSVGG